MTITLEELKTIEHALRDNLKAYQYKNEIDLLVALKIVEKELKRIKQE